MFISRSSSKPLPPQLTIFYAGSVLVYQDIAPEKAQAIMLLAGNGPHAKPVSQPKPQKLVHHSLPTTDPPTMPPSFLPSISYIVSETRSSGSNGVTGLGPTKTKASLASTRNNQTAAFSMAPTVGLPQTRKASLARFLEKRKERY
jgi:jasmonate ZIM domain-containing protein